jgi:hypothetical protein
MTTTYLRLLLLLILSPFLAQAQVGMGGSAHPSAALDIKSTDKALYPPRLTTAARLALPDPQPGAFVFDTDKVSLYLYDGSGWVMLAFTKPETPVPFTGVASDAQIQNYFGSSVSISGDYAIVGAYQAINNGIAQGAAYVFLRTGNTWTQQAKLIANDGAANDNFGSTVAISGSYAIVDAQTANIGNNIDQGAAYVFVRNGTTWTQQAKLTANDGVSIDQFGFSVAMSGDYAIVGARFADVAGNTNQGAAYIFLRNGTTWAQQAKLTANDGAATDYFGQSVAINGTYALVGAPLQNAAGNTNQGAAYVFVRSGTTWTQQAGITASDGLDFDSFGHSVALDGEYALIGAIDDDIGSVSNQGSAYVFKRTGTTWSQQAKLVAPNGRSAEQFGFSIALKDDYALVGGRFLGENTDRAYLYKRDGTTWAVFREVAPAGIPTLRLGNAVGFDNGRFLMGSPGFNESRGKVTFGTVVD